MRHRGDFGHYRALRCVLTLGLLAVHLSACGTHIENPPVGEGEGTLPTGAGFETYVQAVMTKRQIPGLAIAVLGKNGPVYTRTFGYRGVDDKAPVTLRTHFALGSVTKAFTATLAAVLIDNGTIRWDEPLRTYDPGFALTDPTAAAQASFRDLMSHRTGVGRHDELWEQQHLGREEIYEKVKTLPAEHPFRSTFEYSNNMFMVAGYVAGKAAGDSWENLITSRLLRPLGMNETTVSADGLNTTPDHALPHGTNLLGGLIQISVSNSDNIAPAGALNSNLVEMIRWLQFQLAGGLLADGRRLVSEAALGETRKPNILVSPQDIPEIGEANYGLGWALTRYRGRQLITHDGKVSGFQAHVSFLPDDGLGVVILMNSNGLPAQWLGFDTYDQLLGISEPAQWSMKDLAVSGM